MRVLAGNDFETDYVLDKMGNPTEAFVVQWSTYINDGSRHGIGIDSYMAFLGELCDAWDANRNKNTYIMGFHNMDFDMSYLAGRLKQFCDDRGYRFLPICNDAKKIISIRVKERKRNGVDMKFIDTLKLMPLKLQLIGELFGKPKLEPISEDFHQGWSKESDLEDFEYVDRDAEICHDILRLFDNAGLLNASTLAGNALKDAQKRCKLGDCHRGKWKDYFPPLPHDLDMRIRKGYSGGINYSLGRAEFDALEEFIGHYDVTSLYPTVMLYDALPYGTVYKVKNREMAEKFGWYIATHRVKLKRKKNGCPWLKFKSGIEASIEGITTSDPIDRTEQWHVFTWDCVDEKSVLQDYDVEYDTTFTEEYYACNTKVGIFRAYIEHWKSEKERYSKEGNKGMRQVSKLMLNSLYGRLGMSQEFRDTILELDDDIDDFIFLKDGDTEIKTDNNGYIPFAVAVCSNARRRWLEVGREYYREGTLIHGDTDSVIVHKDKIPIPDVYGEEFGQWKDELLETGIRHVYEGGVKRYVEIYKDLNDFEPGKDKLDKFINVTCSGVPQNMKGEPGRYAYGVPVGMWVEILDCPKRIMEDVTLGQKEYKIESEWLRRLYEYYGLNPDKVNTMKLMPRMIKGGKVLVQTTFNTANAGFAIRYRG